MKQYRKKPIIIEAVQYTGNNEHEIMEFAGDGRVRCVPMSMSINPAITIDTLEGVMTATEGDFIIRGVKGEIYPCKPDIFAATYEPVDSDNKAGELSPSRPCASVTPSVTPQSCLD